MKQPFLSAIAFAIFFPAQSVSAESCGSIPRQPDYCCVVRGSDCCPSGGPAKLNEKGKLCHPPESPYYSFVRLHDDDGNKVASLKDCKKDNFDLPDVLLRVCTTAPERRAEALQRVRDEEESVKGFQQKTHLAAGLQYVGSDVRPTAIIHTVVNSVFFGSRNAPELHSWVWGPFISVSPDLKFSLDDADQSRNGTTNGGGTRMANPAGKDSNKPTNDSTGPTIGVGFLISRRPSFDSRGFSFGFGYWKAKDDGGIQFVVSTNMTSFPGMH